jgi:hypothetical protein
MAMTTRLEPEAEQVLVTAALRTGKSRNRLVNEALVKTYGAAAAEFAHETWRIPATRRYTPIPLDRRLRGGPPAEDLVDEQRTERV